jgi:hypothetical protein
MVGLSSVGNAPAAAAPPGVSLADCAAASSLPPDTDGTPAFFPVYSLRGSTAPGFSGSHSEPAVGRSPESATATLSSVPADSHSETWILADAPHGTHAARSPGRRRANSSPPGGAARASHFFASPTLPTGAIISCLWLIPGLATGTTL